MCSKKITKEYLEKNPTHIFVFGDNLLRKGLKGAATLRNEPNVYGFVTKKIPSNSDEAFFTPEEYKTVYKKEIGKLRALILNNPHNTYLISKLGGGLANKYKIWEKIIKPNIKQDLNLPNVIFLWEI